MDRWKFPATAILLFCGLLMPHGPTVAQSVEKSVEEEIVKFETLTPLAEAGDADAQYGLGVIYQEGIAVKKSSLRATHWLQKASDQGHKQATNRLAWHYRNGIGVVHSPAKAEELYLKAYDLGVVGASIPLGAIYRSGEPGVKENHAKAVKWARIGAEAGIDRGENLLGELYRDGKGVEQSFATALEWFEKSAAQGFHLAYFNASVILREGVGVEKDMERGMEYLRTAADLGHAGAMIDLAMSYAEGVGVPQSYQEALNWFTKAARRNDSSAIRLAKAYERGQLGDKDFGRAFMWYYIAAQKGLIEGNVGMASMSARISEQQKARAIADGDAWLSTATTS